MHIMSRGIVARERQERERKEFVERMKEKRKGESPLGGKKGAFVFVRPQV